MFYVKRTQTYEFQLGRKTIVGTPYACCVLTVNFLFISLFSFYQSTVLSSHAVDGHQMYFGSSVVGIASTIGIEISPTRLLIFKGGQKVQ